MPALEGPAVGKPKLWIAAAKTPYDNEYGAVVVLAATRGEAIAKAAAKLELALAEAGYVPRQRYAQALLDGLSGIREAEDDVFVDWAPAQPRQ